MEIIPAIDIIEGKCVRLVKGDYSQKTIYADSPVEVAQSFEAAGIKRLHLVDLDGAKARKVVNLEVLEAISKSSKLDIDFGGGVQSTEDLAKVLKAGAKQITGGSIAIKNQALFLEWIERYGAESIILGADVKDEYIAIHGWEEKSETHLFDFLRFYLEKGLRYVICTDVAKDGMMQGPSMDLYKKVIKEFPKIKLIASGGVSSMDDIKVLAEAGLYGAITGKAIYENKITLEEIADWQEKYAH
jgi:phosphoribosylformimino-5-aminoimidazole carboxamide ribotide isomerase